VASTKRPPDFKDSEREMEERKMRARSQNAEFEKIVLELEPRAIEMAKQIRRREKRQFGLKEGSE